jgi:hypothetical protein
VISTSYILEEYLYIYTFAEGVAEGRQIFVNLKRSIQ